MKRCVDCWSVGLLAFLTFGSLGCSVEPAGRGAPPALAKPSSDAVTEDHSFDGRIIVILLDSILIAGRNYPELNGVLVYFFLYQWYPTA